MKKSYFILGFAIILVSCSNIAIHEYEPLSTSSTYVLEESPEMKLSEAWVLTSSFTYYSDIELYDTENYWANPEEFVEHRGGDCEDFCIYMMWLIGNKNIRMVEIYINSEKHMILQLEDGTYVEPQVYDKTYENTYIEKNIIGSYSYQEVFDILTGKNSNLILNEK